MALCAAHCEEGAALQLERLPAHQMDDMWTNFLHFPAVPLLHGIFAQSIKVFMVSIHEQNRKRQGLQPVKLRIVALVAVPDTAKIAADDHVVILRHLGLLRKVLWLKPEAVPVKITGCINHFHLSNRCLISVPPLICTRISSADRTVTRSTI